MTEQGEKRKIDRVPYLTNGVIVVCDTQEKFYVRVQDVSPLGVGVYMDAGSPGILGKDIIIVTETMIMNADVVRQEKQEDGSYAVGISARKFTGDVLQYLLENIAVKENIQEGREYEK